MWMRCVDVCGLRVCVCVCWLLAASTAVRRHTAAAAAAAARTCPASTTQTACVCRLRDVAGRSLAECVYHQGLPVSVSPTDVVVACPLYTLMMIMMITR